MELKKNIEILSQKTGINIEDKTIYSLYKCIDELDTTPTKAHSFNEIVDKIKDSYMVKSRRNETYFIQNIAHMQNKRTGENLFNLHKTDISKNFKRLINSSVVNRLSDISTKYHLAQNKPSQNSTKELVKYESDMIELSKHLHCYEHNINTAFQDELNSKYSFKKLAKVKYLDYKNKHKTPVMLTFTLDKNYRKYSLYNKLKDKAVLGEELGLREINKNANLEELIEKSYVKLNETFRAFYRDFKNRNQKSKCKDKFDFILVFEPHKSLTLHLHVLGYCNEIQLTNIYKAWDNYLKDLSIKQRKAQDIKIIDKNIANASTYLSKYLIKEYNTDNTDTTFYNMYKSYFSKYKFFRTSNFYNTTQKKIDLMYSYLSKNYPDILELIKSTTVPLYEILEQFELKGIFTFKEEKVDSISFDRKAMKEYSNMNIGYLSHKEIKEDIYSNIEVFSSITKTSRIKMAAFTNNFKLIKYILSSYEIDTQHFIEDDSLAQSDIFYEVGMYEMQEFELSDSLTIADSLFGDF